MRSVPALLVVVLMTAPIAGAVHDSTPVAPSTVTGVVMRDAVFAVNDTIAGIEQKVGEDEPLLIQARSSLVRAGESHNRAQHQATLQALMQALTLAKRAEIQHDTRGASDPAAAFLQHAAAEQSIAKAQVRSVHERMLDLQSLGVDMYLLDHVLLAADILAQGERVLGGWNVVADAWERGQRPDESRNGLVGFAVGPGLWARVAEDLISEALRQQPNEPVGPVVGNATLRGTMEALQPLVQNRSVSVDRQLVGLVNGNMADKEWLAAMGAALAWSRQQAPAQVQHTLDDPEPMGPDVVVPRLGSVLTNDTVSHEAIERLGVPGAHAAFALNHALSAYLVTKEQHESGNATIQTGLGAAEGLGAMSAAHVGLALLLVASGDPAPSGELIHLPRGDAGTIDLGDADGGSPDAGVASSTILWVLIALGVAAVVAVAVVAGRS